METHSTQERKAQLEKWEKDRKQERIAVLFPVLISFFTAFCLADGCYELAKHWVSNSLAAGLSVIAGLMPLFYWLATYLQTWGSYVERRLEDIEAKIDGRVPLYYVSEDGTTFCRQPLHERLERIESVLSEIRFPAKF
jgi:hypothetical protein